MQHINSQKNNQQWKTVSETLSLLPVFHCCYFSMNSHFLKDFGRSAIHVELFLKQETGMGDFCHKSGNDFWMAKECLCYHKHKDLKEIAALNINY